MRYKRVNIDSLNLSDEHLEAMFIYNENYSIQSVKSSTVFEPKEWSETFGKPLKKNIIEAKIIHTYRGISLPLKTFSRSPLRQTLEFAGLHGYNERSNTLLITFTELESQLQHNKLTRIDIAIDYKGNIPKSIIKALPRTREPFKCKNTTYWKTPKELENKEKSNPYMDIKIYDKAHHAKLDYPLMRLEFVFKSRYFNGLLLKDLDLAIIKMEKSIKKAISLNVKINSPQDLKK